MNPFRRLAWISLVLSTSLPSASASADSSPRGPDNTGAPNASEHHETPKMSLPNWAVELAGAPQSFGGQGLLPGRPTAESISTSLQVEYQPAFFQRYGVLGLGPVFTAYPIGQGQGITSGFFSIWSAGGEAKYQARFVDNQALVPSVGYEVEQLTYGFKSGPQGSFTLSGPTLGLEFLLNWLDPKHGADLYELSGISRTYLVGELRDLTGGDGAITASGVSWFVGLRFEM